MIGSEHGRPRLREHPLGKVCVCVGLPGEACCRIGVDVSWLVIR